MSRRFAPLAAVVSLGLLLALHAGCAKEAPSGGRSGQAAPAMDESAARKLGPEGSEGARALGYATGAPDAEPSPAPAPARRLLKTVVLELRVADTRAAADDLKRLAEELGGFVGSVSAQRRDDVFHYSLTLRIPAERLEGAVERIKAMAVELDRESIETEDVTDRFVDLEARLRTLRATETELQGLLAESRQREYDAEDVMAVYRHLTEIRGQIEQIQGQLQVLSDLAALSTVQVELHPTEAARPVVAERWRPGDTAKRAVRGLLAALRALGDLAIVLVVAVLPVALLVALPIVVLARLVRRARRRGDGG